MVQLDLGIRADLGSTRMSLNGFHAWVYDYITYDDIGELFQPGSPRFPFDPGVDFQHVAYVNTDLATLVGFELLGEIDLLDWLTGFALMSYVEGRDHDRTKPSRVAEIIRADAGFPGEARSFNSTTEKEALPGIPPLEARLGLHLHEPCPSPVWGVELEARLVDRQDRIAATLYEAETPGFTLWNARGYWQFFDNFTMFAGVENFTDRFYREHLDYRPGRSVYRPGVNFYLTSELVY
jgi:outer membrane receptor protein involved in Fe transport